MFPSPSKLVACALALTSFLALPASAQLGVPLPVIHSQLFTATVSLGRALSVPIPGGVRLIEPVPNGTVTGPAINGTIFGGLAFPPVLKNGTVEEAEIQIYGNTTDAVPVSFFATISGIGSLKGQVARLEFNIGGKYASLVDKFILASIRPSADRTTVTVNGWEVTQT